MSVKASLEMVDLMRPGLFVGRPIRARLWYISRYFLHKTLLHVAAQAQGFPLGTILIS